MRSFGPAKLAFLLLLAGLGLALVGGCSSSRPPSSISDSAEAEGSGARSGGNLLVNGSFERGTEPWWFFTDRPYWAGFTLSRDYAVDGVYSAHLRLRAFSWDEGTKIWGLIQEVEAPLGARGGRLPFPRRLAGYYRVENWRRATAKQYLQVVIIVWGDPDPRVRELSNIQIRYILAGVTRPPFGIRNARFRFLGPEEPPQGEWVYFERDLHRDFEELWGHIPASVEKIRVLFEVRYDGKRQGEGPGSADVYFDALYLGE